MINKLEVTMDKIAFSLQREDSALALLRIAHEKVESRLSTMEKLAEARLEEWQPLLSEQPIVLSRIETSQDANHRKLDGLGSQLEEAAASLKRLAEEYTRPQEDDLDDLEDDAD